MKTTVLLSAILFGTWCFASPTPTAEPASAEPQTESGVRASSPDGHGKTPRSASVPRRRAALQSRVTLSDGSVLEGTLRSRFLPADTDSLGRIRLDLRAVESISAGASRSGAPARYRVAFRNGDRITVRFPEDLRDIPFDTLLGRVRLPFAAVSRLTLEPPNRRTAQPQNLIYHCTFDDAASIEHPAKGPNGKLLGGSFVPGKTGNALRVEVNKPAFESLLPKGFLGPEGCLEFWAKIEGNNPQYVDGSDPLFVSLYNERGSITLLQFAANNGFARGGLGGAMAGWPFGTIPHYSWSMEYRKVLGDNWAGWHHYAMSWKSGGFGDGSFVKVFVDGRPQPILGGVDDEKVPARLADYGNHEYRLGIPWHASSTDHRTSKRPFLVDDLRIWSVAKTDFASPTPNSGPRLLYHCTFDDTGAVEHPVAGPSGKVLGGEFVPGKKGNALRIPGNVPTALVDLPRGFLQPKGTIEFWSKIENPPAFYGDRGNPRFFGLSLFDDPANPGPCSSYLQFTSNDGMGMSGLCGMIFHRAMATDPQMRTNTYGPLLGDPAAWHHYAIVWDSDGLPFSKAADGTPAVATIVLDGRALQTFGRNDFARGKSLLRLPELQGKLAFPVSDTNWGYFPHPIAFLIDEFKIWSVVKTDFVVSSAQPPNCQPTQPPKLLYHCTFDDAGSVERPAAGPSGTVLDGEFVPGKVGNALFVKAGTHAAEVPFPTGLMQPEGCIEFWGKIPGATKETTFPDGGNPTFFAMGVGKWVNTFVKYTSNDGFGTGGLHADLPGSAYISSLPSWSGSARYPDFLGDPAAWHHYALVWSDRGLDAASEALGRRVVSALYVDGKLVNPAYGMNGPDRAKSLSEFVDNPVVLAFPIVPGRQPEWQNRVNYLIDDFKIWNFPKTEFAVP